MESPPNRQGRLLDGGWRGRDQGHNLGQKLPWIDDAGELDPFQGARYHSSLETSPESVAGAQSDLHHRRSDRYLEEVTVQQRECIQVQVLYLAQVHEIAGGVPPGSQESKEYSNRS